MYVELPRSHRATSIEPTTVNDYFQSTCSSAILSCSKQGRSLVSLCGSAVEASDSAEQVLEFGKNAVSIVLAHS